MKRSHRQIFAFLICFFAPFPSHNPNPVNPTTTIRYALLYATEIQLAIYEQMDANDIQYEFYHLSKSLKILIAS
jgi:hypothetical protein